MSLGAGIFLSVLIVCLLVLYLATRDRWRWGRILLWSIGSLVGLILLVGGGISGYWTYQNRPVVQTEYLNVPLGVTKEEVLYRLGAPTGVYREATEEEEKSFPDELKGSVILANQDGKYPPGKSAKDYDYWEWQRFDAPFTVAFRDNLVVRINCYAPEGKYCPPMLGIGTGYTEQQVLDKLGEPTKSKLSPPTSKDFEYPDLNVSIGFTKQKVNVFTVQKLKKAP